MNRRCVRSAYAPYNFDIYCSESFRTLRRERLTTRKQHEIRSSCSDCPARPYHDRHCDNTRECRTMNLREAPGIAYFPQTPKHCHPWAHYYNFHAQGRRTIRKRYRAYRIVQRRWGENYHNSCLFSINPFRARTVSVISVIVD